MTLLIRKNEKLKELSVVYVQDLVVYIIKFFLLELGQLIINQLGFYISY